MNGIKLLVPEAAARILYGLILIVNVFVFVKVVLPKEQRIINTSTYLKNGGAIDFEKMSQELFVWSKAWIGKAY